MKINVISPGDGTYFFHNKFGVREGDWLIEKGTITGEGAYLTRGLVDVLLLFGNTF